jgi:hypothetical protein
VSNVTVATWRTWKNAPTTPPDAVVQAGIDAAETVIAQRCGRAFVVASASTTRLFAPGSACTDVVEIDDATAVTVVAQNGTTVPSTAYQLEPVNGRNQAGEVVPYSRVRLLGSEWSQTYRGEASVSVTGTFGWAALPAEYLEAVKILSADIIDARDQRNGAIGFADLGITFARENKTVAYLISRLQRGRSYGFA